MSHKLQCTVTCTHARNESLYTNPTATRSSTIPSPDEAATSIARCAPGAPALRDALYSHRGCMSRVPTVDTGDGSQRRTSFRQPTAGPSALQCANADYSLQCAINIGCFVRTLKCRLRLSSYLSLYSTFPQHRRRTVLIIPCHAARPRLGVDLHQQRHAPPAARTPPMAPMGSAPMVNAANMGALQHVAMECALATPLRLLRLRPAHLHHHPRRRCHRRIRRPCRNLPPLHCRRHHRPLHLRPLHRRRRSRRRLRPRRRRRRYLPRRHRSRHCRCLRPRWL